MSYYQRPMGDYKTYGYAGDPGWLSALWKGVKTVGKMILGVPPKQISPVGTIMAGAGTAMALRPTPPTPSIPGQIPGFGATGPVGRGGPYSTDAQFMAQQGGLPRGYHWAKDGSGRAVRNRRMNVANPRALRKAMRRVQGFEKLAKRTLVMTKRVRMKKVC